MHQTTIRQAETQSYKLALLLSEPGLHGPIEEDQRERGGETTRATTPIKLNTAL